MVENLTPLKIHLIEWLERVKYFEAESLHVGVAGKIGGGERLVRRNNEKFQQLTEFEWGRIIGLREGGFSYRAIGALVQWNSFIVMRVSKQWTDEHRTTRKTCSGRRKVTSARDDQQLHRMVGMTVQLPPGSWQHVGHCYRCTNVGFVNSSTSAAPWNACKGDFIQNPPHGKPSMAASVVGS
ncbi:uncharacterized protein TNCV_1255331 [Trichonephila clavipes]|nr:uncharacterized protein TNCV_1255331 [Trichonephila clavipes]